MSLHKLPSIDARLAYGNNQLEHSPEGWFLESLLFERDHQKVACVQTGVIALIIRAIAFNDKSKAIPMTRG